MISSSIAITGVSSFTGHWIARAFSEAGWKVHGLCSRSKDAYQGMALQRLENLPQSIHLHFEVSSFRMADWIQEFHPTLWVHHFHYMENFRKPSYDLKQMRATCLDPLPAVVTALRENAAKGVIYSSTYFAPEEGGVEFEHSVSPYGESKAQVRNQLQSLCREAKLPFSQIVIPNPVGAFENGDRLIPQLIAHAKQSESFLLKDPDAIFDNLPVRELAKVYVDSALELLAGRPTVRRPSGWIGPAKDWVTKVQKELIHDTLGFTPCPILPLSSAEPGSSVMGRTNPSTERRDFRWEEVWSDYRSMLQLGK